VADVFLNEILNFAPLCRAKQADLFFHSGRTWMWKTGGRIRSHGADRGASSCLRGCRSISPRNDSYYEHGRQTRILTLCRASPCLHASMS